MSISSQLLGFGSAAATGNYVAAGVDLVGLGVSLFGGAKQASDAKQASLISGNINRLEGQVNDQREQAMQLSARRQQLEIIRNTQRARSMGLQAAVSQGAQFGSGYSGGQAQELGMGSFNLQGVNQNLQSGENIFSINRDISKSKLALSQVQGQAATDAGISAIGGSIMKAGDPLGRLAGQFYSSGPMTLGGPDGPTAFS